MARNALAAMATVAAILAAAPATAATIESNRISFNDKAATLVFDFSGDAQYPLVKSNSLLIGIESYWTLTPGAGQTGSLDLLAQLQAFTPPIDVGSVGVDTRVGFSTTVDLSAGPQQAQSTYTAETGLTFSADVIGKLLNGEGKLTTQLFASGTGFSNLDNFFTNGGTISGFARLITKERPGNPGGGGENPVPEPASMLVWGAVAAGVALRRKQAATA
jgi:hypothetical protein